VAVRLLTISHKPGGNPEHPYIHIGGKWLKDYGYIFSDPRFTFKPSFNF